MVLLLLVIAVLFALATAGAFRTVAVIIYFIYATFVLFLGFIVGSLWTFFAYPNAIRQWTLLDSWVTMIVDSPNTGILALFSTPFVFIADCYRWIVDITIFQGNPVLWLTMAIAVWVISKNAIGCYKSFEAGRKAASN